MIDTAYDGKVFNVAVKIIDKPGEEALVVAEVRRENMLFSDDLLPIVRTESEVLQRGA